jgi:hypothetical protein
MKKFRLFFLLSSLLLCVAGSNARSNGDPVNFTIEINPVFGNKKLIPGKTTFINAAGDTLSIELFRFYLSSFKLVFENGTEFVETNSYHLIDIIDSTHPTITIKNIPAGKIQKVEFSIGVDSTKCVAGALEGDLDPVNGMYWSWNSGYINAKIEGKSKSCKTFQNAFEFHIGGYLPQENSLRKVTLPLKNSIASGKLVLNANAEAWFSNIKLSETNSIVIPGKAAMKMADNYSKMFSLEEN